MRRAGGIAAWAACVLCACSQVAVVEHAPADQAARIVQALDRAGVHADHARDESNRVRVSVDRDQVARAVAVLRDEGLPRDEPHGVSATFGEGSMFPSPIELRARSAAAIASELETTLGAMHGVRDVRVHIGLTDPSASGLDEEPAQPSASVVLHYRGERAMLDASDVKRVVAGAVAGLTEARVSVLMERAPDPWTEPAKIERLWWIDVESRSLGRLRAVMIGMVGAIVALTIAVIWLWRKKLAA